MQWASLTNVAHRRVHDILALAAQSEPVEEESDRILGEEINVLSVALRGVYTGLVCKLQVFRQRCTLMEVDVEPASEDSKLDGEPVRYCVAGGQAREDVV